MLEVTGAFFGGDLLPLRELLVLVADDVVVACLRLLLLVGQRARELQPRVVELGRKLAHHAALPRVVELGHSGDGHVQPGLRLRAQPPLVLYLLDERDDLELRLVELLADVEELLASVVNRLLPLHPRDVSLQNLPLGRILPARVRDVARDACNLRG